MDNSPQTQNQEEISLFDLFIVLLRYRKLIAGIIVLFIVLSIAGYFIIPVFQYNKAKSRLLKQGIIQMEIVPKARPYISQDLDSFILRSDLIYDSLSTAGMKYFSYPDGGMPLDDENIEKAMYLIDMFWIKNMDLRGNVYIQNEQDKTFSVRRIGTSSVFEVTLKNKDPELIDNFLKSIYSLSAVNVGNTLRPVAQMMVTDYERLMQITEATYETKTVLERDFDIYTFFKDFLAGKAAVVNLVSGPVFFVEGFISLFLYQDQYYKTGIIIGFAGLFLAFALPFILNAIRVIKNDEEAMKKIRDALDNSGTK